jgi:outer membrane protein
LPRKFKQRDPAVQIMTKRRSQFIALTLVAPFVLLENSARAQDLSDATQQDAIPANHDHLIVGLGTGYFPAYEGADKYRVLPLPAIDVKWGPFFVGLGGIGFDVVDTKWLTVGTSLTFVPGYRRGDVPEGIGRLSTGAGGRVFASLKAGGWVATIGATQTVAGATGGATADVSLSRPIVVTPRLTLIPTIGTTWADAKYNNRYFGVDAQQSLASGLPQFAPGAGIKDATAFLTTSYRLTEHLILGVSAGATTVLGDVKDSPIVFHKNAQPTGFLSIAYRF